MKMLTIATVVLASTITAASAQYAPNDNPQNDPQQEMLIRGRTMPPESSFPAERYTIPRARQLNVPSTTGQGQRETGPAAGGAPAGYPRSDYPETGR